jgi:hypothetical protein
MEYEERRIRKRDICSSIWVDHPIEEERLDKEGTGREKDDTLTHHH